MPDVTLDRVAEVSRSTATLLRELVPLLAELGLPSWSAQVSDLEAMHAALAADYGEQTKVSVAAAGGVDSMPAAPGSGVELLSPPGLAGPSAMPERTTPTCERCGEPTEPTAAVPSPTLCGACCDCTGGTCQRCAAYDEPSPAASSTALAASRAES